VLSDVDDLQEHIVSASNALDTNDAVRQQFTCLEACVRDLCGHRECDRSSDVSPCPYPEGLLKDRSEVLVLDSLVLFLVLGTECWSLR